MDAHAIHGLAAQLGAALVERRLMVAVAESCTGGPLAGALTSGAGSSAWFERGFVTYSNQAKIEMLDVDGDTLETYGAVSEEVAREMAEGALIESRAQIAVAITGIAGPGGATPGKPVGTVCFGWAEGDGAVQVETLRFDGDRAAVRQKSVQHAIGGLLLRTLAFAARSDDDEDDDGDDA